MTLKTTLFTSLDNRVDASSDWQFPWFDEEYFAVLSAMWGQAQALLIGANSFAGYEQLADTFPDSPMIELIRSKTTYVVSSSRSSSTVFPDTLWLRDASPSTIDEMERRHTDVLILGSPALTVQLLENGSLKELNLAIMPTVVNVGRGLYDSATQPLTFSSARTHTLRNGVTMLDLAV